MHIWTMNIYQLVYFRSCNYWMILFRALTQTNSFSFKTHNHSNCASRAFTVCKYLPPVTTIVTYSPLLSLFFTEIRPYKAPHNGASGMECTICLWQPIVITKTNCFIPITHAKWECNNEKMRLSTCNETIQPPEKWHNVSIGGRVCWESSLSGAEMSRNP